MKLHNPTPSDFVAGWRKEYESAAGALPLFNTAWVARLTPAQREFFRVHVAVRHYEVAYPLLRPIWKKNPGKVKAAFAGIAQLQLDVWQELSQRVFTYR